MIYASRQNNNIIICAAPVEYQTDLYSLPIKSSLINEYEACKSTSDPKIFNLDDIKCKLFCIEYGEKLAFIPVIHSLDIFTKKIHL